MTIIDQQAASKVRVLDAATALPGTCVICGSPGGDGRKFVDIDMDIEYYGAVYFCSHCMNQVAQALGCLMPEDVDILRSQYEGLQQDRLEARNKEKLVDEFLANLFSLGAVYRSSVDHLTSTSISDEISKDSELSDDGEPEPDPFSVELNLGERSDDISGTSSSNVPGSLNL